jgi:hypothetical protein
MTNLCARISALVIARSVSDEAIQLPAQAALDCFADARNDAPLIPPRAAGKGDRPAQQGGGRGDELAACCAAAGPLHRPSGGPPPPHSVRGRIKHNRSRGAFERPSLAHHQPNVRKKQKEGRRSAERRIVRQLPLARQRGLFERRARLPALRHGTRHRLSPRWLSPRPGFPQRRGGAVFCRHAAKPLCVQYAPYGPVLVPAA